jgi:5-methylcytosine-specific restriction endonuclease McrA
MTLSTVERRIAALLLEHPEGLTIKQIRHELQLKGDEHQHLDRRTRKLDEYYELRRERRGRDIFYVLGDERTQPKARTAITPKDRARVLLEANGNCAMCGRNTKKHGIDLQVDHVIPVEWGGTSRLDNLQALCEECNRGKRNYFAGFDRSLMQRVMAHSKIHARIGELLSAMAPEFVPSYLLAAVAGGQEDWQKRTRELRVLDWVISTRKQRNEAGLVRSAYRADKIVPLPLNPAAEIRRREMLKKKRNK